MQNTNQSKPDQRNSSHEKCLSELVRRALENVNNFYSVKFLSACRSVKKPTKPNLNFLCMSRRPITNNGLQLPEGREFENEITLNK
jgi:hypothetical protein